MGAGGLKKKIRIPSLNRTIQVDENLSDKQITKLVANEVIPYYNKRRREKRASIEAERADIPPDTTTASLLGEDVRNIGSGMLPWNWPEVIGHTGQRIRSAVGSHPVEEKAKAVGDYVSSLTGEGAFSGLASGAAEKAAQVVFSAPEIAANIGAATTGGGATLVPMLSKWVKDAFGGGIEEYKAANEAFKSGDYETAARHAAKGAVDFGFGATMAGGRTFQTEVLPKIRELPKVQVRRGLKELERETREPIPVEAAEELALRATLPREVVRETTEAGLPRTAETLAGKPKPQEVKDAIETRPVEPGRESERVKTEEGRLPEEASRSDSPVESRPVAEEVAPESRAFGITPSGSEFLNKALEWATPAEQGKLPAIIVDASQVVPRLQPYHELKLTASNPHGMGAVHGLGTLFDPRATARTGADKAIIARAWSINQGKSIRGMWEASQFRNKELFPVDEATGTIALTDGKRGYLADVVEAEMGKPGSQPITEAQRSWIRNEWEPLLKDVQSMLSEEGVKRFAAEYDLDGNATTEIDLSKPYFPRSPVGKRAKEAPKKRASSGPPGVKPSFAHHRRYASEAEGVLGKQQVIYDPNFASRVGGVIESAYRAIADTRLSKDADLMGRTAKDRFHTLKQQNSDKLSQLKGAEKKAVLEELKNRAREPVWLDERSVSVAPAFTGKTFPVEIADKLQKAYSQGGPGWAKTAEKWTSASKAFVLTLDMSAPFVQGLATLYRNPRMWARATVNSWKSLLDPDVLSRVLEQPENALAAREFIQSGGSMIQRQDFLSGTAPGGAATKVPVLGRGVEATGRAFGVFLDLAKLEMWKARKDLYPKEMWSKLAEDIESQLFLGRMDQIGMSPSRMMAERLSILAPSYYRGAANLVATSFGKGLSARQAQKTLASYATGVALTSIAGMLAVGLSWDEIKKRLVPNTGKFMRIPIKLGDGKTVEVGFGNVLMRLPRLIGESFDYFGQDNPIDTGKEGNPYVRELSGKFALLPGLFTDFVTGTDYLGNRYTMTEASLRRFMPLVGQALLEGEGEAMVNLPGRENVADAMFSFLGAQSYPGNFRDEEFAEVQRISLQDHGKDYTELTLDQQASVFKKAKNSGKLKKPDTTIQQMKRAFAAQEQRRNELMSSMSSEAREKLGTLDHELPTFKLTFRINGEDVPLTREQADDYKAFLIEEYEKAIALWNEDALLKSSGASREKFMSDSLKEAKESAKSRIHRKY